MKKTRMLPVLALALAACATPNTNIVARDNGSYSVTSMSYSSDKAYRAAVDAAESYCKKMGKKSVTVHDGAPSGDTYEQAANNREPQSASFDRDKHSGVERPSPDASVTIDFKCI